MTMPLPLCHSAVRGRCFSLLYVANVFLCIVRNNALSTSFYGKNPRNVATQVLEGAGAAQVDMNQYNLRSLSQIEEEWTANVVQESAEKNSFLKLGVKSDQRLFVDLVHVAFPRRNDDGLGIRLTELAGGGEDDRLGITVVSDLVSGGAAEGSDIMPGDCLSKVAVVRRRRTTRANEKADAAGIAEREEVFTADTECLSYESTVEAILSLPPRQNEEVFEEFYKVSLKRIRRKPKVTVSLKYPESQCEPDTKIEMFAGENLRLGMLKRGIKLNDQLALRFDTKNGGNCGAGGLCRTCAVSVLKGGDLFNPQRIAEKQMLAENPRWRLACKAIVGFGMKEGYITIKVNPRQWEEP